MRVATAASGTVEMSITVMVSIMGVIMVMVTLRTLGCLDRQAGLSNTRDAAGVV